MHGEVFHTHAITPSDLTSTAFAVFPSEPPPRRLTARVLHVINGEHFSGAERVQQLLGRRLPEHGVAVDFAICKPGRFASHCGLPAESLHEFPMRSRFDRGAIAAIASLHRRQQFGLLHAHTPRTAMVAAAAARSAGLPWVYHVHSPAVRDSNHRLRNWANALIERRSLASCSAVITVSQSLKLEMVHRGVRVEKISVVPNGVETQESIDAAERIGRRGWRLGVVALFRPRKGLEVLLEAFDRLCEEAGDRRADYELQIIGGFESEAYERQIRDQVASLANRSRVHLQGFVTDAPYRMRSLDWLVLPSLFGEGMPMVVLEAMASGVPVVATAVEGTPEVVREGVEGFLAAPQDVGSLAQALATACRCRRSWAVASAAAAKRQREMFSDAAMAAGVAGVYAGLLSRE